MQGAEVDGVANNEVTKVFVGGISTSTTEADVRTYFENFLGGGGVS